MTLFLRVIDGRLPPQVFRLDDPCRLRIGRRQDSDILLQDRSVSRRHCVLEVANGRIRVTDTQSRNGIWVNDTRLSESVTVGAGTVLRMAAARLEVQTDPGIDAESYHWCQSARRLISLLPCRGSSRKLRLLACAWYRHLIGFVPDGQKSRLVEAAEAHADGLLSADDMAQQRTTLGSRQTSLGESAFFEEGPAQLTTSSAREAAESLLRSLDGISGIDGVTVMLTGLTRDVLGDFLYPFRPPKEWLEWNGETVRRMARTIYDERDFTSLPILADALEDAGCTDEMVLRHCREAAVHVRGCWVLDALLETQRPQFQEPGPDVTLAPHSASAEV